MRHASLFTGIGGFDLAANWMGWQNVFQVEIDPWCQQLLAKRFPNTSKHTDIKAFDGTQYHGAVDIISGGFPCQPYSAAGKRLGKDDERHLWPEMLRVIHEVQPSWVVGENVRGLTNWNGGLVFDEVQADLELAGYQVLPFLLPACGVNAPHRRDRIWFVAYSDKHGQLRRSEAAGGQQNQGRFFSPIERPQQSGPVAYSTGQSSAPRAIGKPSQQEQRQSGGGGGQDALPYSNGQLGRPQAWELSQQSEQRRHVQADKPNGSSGVNDWRVWPTVSPVCRRDDGIPNRVDRLRGLGNAIVPQVALQIFKAIHEYANL